MRSEYATQPFPRERSSYEPRRYPAAYRRRRDRRRAALAVAVLLLVLVVTAAHNPVGAVLLVAGAGLVVVLVAAWRQLGPAYAAAVLAVVTASCAVACTFASSTLGRQPAERVAVVVQSPFGWAGSHADREFHACAARVARVALNRPGLPACLWGEGTRPPATATPTTTRAGEAAR